MNPKNWISHTGLRPYSAMPIDVPTMPASASGVSMTRSAPNCSYKPSVTRKTPPSRPTSSPSTTTSESLVISCRSARLRACTMVSLAMGHLLPAAQGCAQLLLLCLEIRWLGGKHVVEHICGIKLAVGLGFLDSPPHFGIDFALDLGLPALIPQPFALQILAEARNGIVLLPFLFLALLAVPGW